MSVAQLEPAPASRVSKPKLRVFSWKKTLRRLGSAEVFFWILVWLIVLLSAGTIAQKYIGLHQAQEQYFSSWVLTIGGWSLLPGGRLTLLLLFVSLTAKLFCSSFKLKNIGVVITHLGTAVLLFGGFLTALNSIEGSMLIPEGEQRNFFEDYEQREFSVVRKGSTADQETVFFGSGLSVGAVLEHEDLPASMRIISSYKNCSLVSLDHLAPANRRGLAQKAKLVEQALDPERHKNRAGIEFEILEGDAKGIYIATDQLRDPQQLKSSGQTYHFSMRYLRHTLPFDIFLDDFQREFHPGTQMARSYRSLVRVGVGESKQQAVIQMNEPLRRLGYTFYQSSFIEGNGQDATVLSVVKNSGRLFPYISSIVICIGLMLHLAIRSWPKKNGGTDV